MAINTIQDLINKKGKDYVDSLLNNDVIITENLDTYRFLFKKEGDYIKFFKKNNMPLNLVERTLNDVWENAISEIPRILHEKDIPDNLTFGIAYTPVKEPIRIKYENLPTYVLTDISERDGNKAKHYDYDKITEWAEYLNLGKPPVIFKGKLTEEQKETILKYSDKEFKGTESKFTMMINEVFNSTYSNNDVIEGIILKGNDGQLVKITSYEFDILNEAYENIQHTKDFYDLTILSMNKILENYNVPNLQNESQNENYIEIVSDIFNRYCKEYDISENSFDPKYLAPPSHGYLGNLNKMFITNQETLDLLNKGPVHESLFKVILSSLRRRKKPNNLLNESGLSNFNNYVELLNSLINNYDIIEEGTPLTDVDQQEIEPLNEARSENVVIGELNKDINSGIDNMRVIGSIQKAFSSVAGDIKKGEKGCAVYITSCRPFSNNNLQNMQDINKKWQLPVIPASVSNNKKMPGDTFVFSDNIKISQLELLTQNYSNISPNYILLDSWSLAEIFELCRPHFEPMVIITDSTKKSEFAIQLYFEEEIMGKRLNVDDAFNVGEMNAEDVFMGYRAIEDNDAVMFKEYTPNPMWNLFEKMVAEYKTWSGQILTI